METSNYNRIFTFLTEGRTPLSDGSYFIGDSIGVVGAMGLTIVRHGVSGNIFNQKHTRYETRLSEGDKCHIVRADHKKVYVIAGGYTEVGVSSNFFKSFSRKK